MHIVNFSRILRWKLVFTLLRSCKVRWENVARRLHGKYNISIFKTTQILIWFHMIEYGLYLFAQFEYYSRIQNVFRRMKSCIFISAFTVENIQMETIWMSVRLKLILFIILNQKCMKMAFVFASSRSWRFFFFNLIRVFPKRPIVLNGNIHHFVFPIYFNLGSSKFVSIAWSNH